MTRKQKIQLGIGLLCIVLSTIGAFWLLYSHKQFNHAIAQNLPTESLRPIYLYDIVILLFFGLIGLVSLLVVMRLFYKVKTQNY